MTEVLVTGASGFIGAHLKPHLVAGGFKIIATDRASGDVTDAATWSGFPDVDAVVHLAGRSFVPDSWNDPGAFIEANVIGTVRALEYCAERGAALVFLSSYLYGEPEALPIAETATLTAGNPYALSKKLAEDVCRFYFDRHQVPVAILRPFNVYGPAQRTDFLIPSVLLQVKRGVPIRVRDGAPRRDYVYVGDVVSAIRKAVERRPDFLVANVGSGVSHSVAEVIELIQDVSGTHLPVSYDGERRRNEVMETVADISRARDTLGWTPEWDLREGLRSCFESFNER